MSYPEKFMYSVLEQTEVNFERELSFRWSKGRRYDFYIPSFNCIIETHGAQHYTGSFETIGGRSLIEEIENDENKMQMANLNGIDLYIVIDCRKSESDYIKMNILKSDLKYLLDLTKVNWLKCHEDTTSTSAKEACDLWNSGIKNTVEIGKILKIDRSTIGMYLKQGVKLGWCDYDPLVVRRENVEKIRENIFRKVIQFSLSGEYIKKWNSIAEASVSLGMKRATNISLTCNGGRQKAGGYQWLYKEDYENGKKTPKLLEEKDKIVQLTLNGKYVAEYNSAYNACMSLGFDDYSSSIYKCCRGTLNQTMGYMWMFKRDYENNKILKQYINTKIKPVVQLTLKGDFIKEWEGAYVASKELGISTGRLSEACNGKRKSANGFIWMFKDDFLNLNI